MAIKKGQSLGYEGVSIGDDVLEARDQEKICCPQNDSDKSGELNLLKSSCVIRQQDPTQPLCYGGCKGEYHEVNPTCGQHKTKTAQHTRSKAGKEIVDKIVSLYTPGCDLQAIADKVCRSKKLVELRLKEAGVFVSSRPAVSGRKKVFAMLEEDPTQTCQQIQERTGISRSSCETYMREWRRL